MVTSKVLSGSGSSEPIGLPEGVSVREEGFGRVRGMLVLSGVTREEGSLLLPQVILVFLLCPVDLLSQLTDNLQGSLFLGEIRKIKKNNIVSPPL